MLPPYYGNDRQLKLIGITYNQIESGVYAVILQEVDGERRIPIIIGFPEAQAIECRLQEIVPPRPLTHDLMADVMDRFGIRLELVEIYKLPNGVFGAHLNMTNGVEKHVVDSRSSDAIALAIRVGAPIVTTEEVLSEVGFIPDAKPAGRSRVAGKSSKGGRPNRQSDFDTRTDDELAADMQAAAENENYELAARIKAELDRRKNISESPDSENP